MTSDSSQNHKFKFIYWKLNNKQQVQMWSINHLWTHYSTKLHLRYFKQTCQSCGRWLSPHHQPRHWRSSPRRNLSANPISLFRWRSLCSNPEPECPSGPGSSPARGSQLGRPELHLALLWRHQRLHQVRHRDEPESESRQIGSTSLHPVQRTGALLVLERAWEETGQLFFLVYVSLN